MPNWLHNALFWAVIVIVMLVLAAIPFGLVLWLGIAWAILGAIALAVLIGWLCGKAGPAAGFIAFPAWTGVAVGLAGGMVWKIFGAIVAVMP